MAAALAVVLAGALLAGCAPSDPETPHSTATPSSSATGTSTATPEPSPTETAPGLIADGAAADNLPYFASIVAAVWAGPENVSGRAYIDALVAGGFDKSAMQVTRDETTVGNPAESIQFSVLWVGECLVGQVGPATGAPVAIVLPPVGADECLIGDTRPIDW